jgi:hypothetical protein
MPFDAEASMTQSVTQFSATVGLLMAVICTPAAAGQRQPPPSAQPQKQIARPEWQQASLASGKVQGVVHDDRGQIVSGVRISAVGTTTALAFSDSTGRFMLPLPPGGYVLRAYREGYTSTYRDLIMVRGNVAIEKTITVTKQANSAARAVMVAGVAGGPFAPASAVETAPDHSHNEAIWRMNHLKRPVLRDVGTAVADAARAQNFRAHTTGFFDWALVNSARLATSLITGPNYTGQVNFVTTSAVDLSTGWSQPEGPRNVAYVSLSAPVGSVGDWRVRGAMNAADLSSWVLLGEFAARESRSHAFSFGMAYSTQNYTDPAPIAFSADAATTRAVGGVYGADRWRILDGLELEYGVRWDRYSYVANAPNMVSPRVGGRVRVAPRLSVVGQAAQRMIAPGSTEFLPPAAAGPWLPPERTFASLSPSGTFRAERVRHYDLGLEQAFATDGTLSLRRFRQGTDDQTATIFGLNTDGSLWAAGHYSVASIGGVTVDGWTMRAAGRISKRLSGSVEYSVGTTRWASDVASRRVEMVAPSAVRRGNERLQDLLTSIDVAVPGSETRLSLICRMDTAFSRATGQSNPAAGARFDMQISQALPFQPLRGGRLEVLMAMSNLFRDLRQPGSLYDELLTVAPPVRLLGGVQIRF